jgi:hypothetical protein
MRLLTFIMAIAGVTADNADRIPAELPEERHEQAAPPRPESLLLEEEEADEDVVSMLQVKRELAPRELLSSRSATPDMQVYTAVAADEANQAANKAKEDTMDLARGIREKIMALAKKEVKEAAKHGKCDETVPKPTGLCRSALANVAHQQKEGDNYVDAAVQLADKLVDQASREGKKEEEKARDQMQDMEAKIEDNMHVFKNSVTKNADKLKGDVKAEGDALLSKAVSSVTEKPPEGAKGGKNK